MKYYLALLCYYLGHFTSKIMLLWSPLGYLYPIYNKLMCWSSDLDIEEKLWTKKKEEK